LSGFDAKITLACYPALLDRLENATESSKQELRRVIRKVWEIYYALAEDRDMPFHLAVLLHDMGYYAEALEYYEHSVDLYGPDAVVAYNSSLCHYCLRQIEEALKSIDEALALDPDSKDARAMRIRIEAMEKSWPSDKATRLPGRMKEGEVYLKDMRSVEF